MTGFVVIEGVPAVGKTTLAGSVAGHLGGPVMQLPESFRAARDVVNRDDDVPAAAWLTYYLAGTIHLAARIERQLAVESVVCDRYLASVLALAEAEGGLTEADVGELSRPFRERMPVADLTIVLEADHEVIIDRLDDRSRGDAANQKAHRRTATDVQFADTWAGAIVRWSSRLGPTVRIDTSSMTTNQVAENAISAIEVGSTAWSLDL